MDVLVPYYIMGLIISYIVLCVIFIRFEEKKWNHGICSKCGKPWRYKYSSRKGGHVYYCKNGHYIKIKYGSDQEW